MRRNANFRPLAPFLTSRSWTKKASCPTLTRSLISSGASVVSLTPSIHCMVSTRLCVNLSELECGEWRWVSKCANCNKQTHATHSECMRRKETPRHHQDAPARQVQQRHGDHNLVSVGEFRRVDQLAHPQVVQRFVAEVQLGVEPFCKGRKEHLVVGGLRRKSPHEPLVASDRAAKHVEVLC